MFIENLGIVGCGTMGTALVDLAASSGFDVLAIKLTSGDPSGILRRVSGSLSEKVRHGEINREARDKILGRIHPTSDLDAVGLCDMAIETTIESLEIKRRVLADIDSRQRQGSILASHSGSLRLGLLAQTLLRPCRFIGLQVFMASPYARIAEIAATTRTAATVIEATMAFVARLGRVPVRVREQPGGVAYRLLIPRLTHAIAMLESGVASVDEIDRTSILSGAHDQAPFALADGIGLDTLLAMSRNLAAEHQDSRYAAPGLLHRLVSMGSLGVKTGLGFYDYAADPPLPNPMLSPRVLAGTFVVPPRDRDRPSIA